MRKPRSGSIQKVNRKWEAIISPTALREIDKLPLDIARDILDKIEWLCNEVEIIKHSRLKGGEEFSLHSGQYRILYILDRLQHQIDILDIGKHDEVYKRLRKRQHT